MIVDEVNNVLKLDSENDQIKLIGELTDEFRSGRDPSQLWGLIETDDKDILDIALYIIGEINISSEDILQNIIFRLVELSAHENSLIRYKVLLNVVSFAERINSRLLKDFYIKMSNDPDIDVRETAHELLHNLRSAKY